jgi:hypothetical protein
MKAVVDCVNAAACGGLADKTLPKRHTKERDHAAAHEGLFQRRLVRAGGAGFRFRREQRLIEFEAQDIAVAADMIFEVVVVDGLNEVEVLGGKRLLDLKAIALDNALESAWGGTEDELIGIIGHGEADGNKCESGQTG